MRIVSIDEAHEALVKHDGPVKERTHVQGVPVDIENPKGTERKWHDPKTGEHGSNKMHHPYGFIPGVKDNDGDSVDVFVGPHPDSGRVFVINQRQLKDLRKFDEHKIMLGFRTEQQARNAYLMHYDHRGPQMLGSIVVWTMERFKRWLDAKGKKDKPVRA